jgi:hypothetical protein
MREGSERKTRKLRKSQFSRKDMKTLELQTRRSRTAKDDDDDDDDDTHEDKKNIYNKKGMSVTISIKRDKALGNPELPKELKREEELQLLGNESRRAEAIKRLSKK